MVIYPKRFMLIWSSFSFVSHIHLLAALEKASVLSLTLTTRKIDFLCPGLIFLLLPFLFPLSFPLNSFSECCFSGLSQLRGRAVLALPSCIVWGSERLDLPLSGAWGRLWTVPSPVFLWLALRGHVRPGVGILSCGFWHSFFFLKIAGSAELCWAGCLAL